MSYDSKVFNVMIASPGDVPVQRIIVREEVYDWNAIHSLRRQIVLLPTGWDTHSSPDMGERPQGILNKQVLERADLLVAVFGNRLGSHTGKHESGTVEEIKEHVAAGKPAMLYFSTTIGDSANFDVEQFTKLQEFQKWCSMNGLFQTYSSDDVFRSKFRRDLSLKLNDHPMFQHILIRAHTQDHAPAPISGDSESIQFSRKQGSVSPDPASKPNLTDKAMIMLKEASIDPSGYILVISMLGGTEYQANSKQLNLSKTQRELAEWEEALEQLGKNDFVRQKNQTGKGLRLYEMTSKGYTVADQIDEETKTWIK